MSSIIIHRAGPMATLQDGGRFGMLAHGVSASGPMDGGAYRAAGALLGLAGTTAIEFTQGIEFEAEERLYLGFAGGDFKLSYQGTDVQWPGILTVRPHARVTITPGENANYGYLRFDREVDVPVVLGSRSTNVTVGLGGYRGRPLKAGDRLTLGPAGTRVDAVETPTADGPIRVVWGLHAALFDGATRQKFVDQSFLISTAIDRMGIKLIDPVGVFDVQKQLTLVSDAIVPGDIQILGDGTPIVLMRDHQPTGGYPRIATIVTADLDRFAQMRPGAEIRFKPVTLEHAR